ncbi:MAG: sialate O-acetylesterase [Puniceicoccales bacterium]|nr:sialate O-acetylesterase [Puniceicoccales bacterium]
MYSTVKSLTLALCMCLCAVMAQAGSLKTADIFGGSMVLQREAPLPIWGEALPGEEVKVSFAGQTRATKADASGKWRVTLAPLPASAEGRDLSVSSGDEALTFRNVLVGEVWLASGQSNMEWGLLAPGVLGAAEIVASGDYPNIRLFAVNKAVGNVPKTSFPHFPWVPCSPKTLKRGPHHGSFSAVAYLYALELHKKLGVPVGIIESAWGGTRIEPWTPSAAFKLPEVPQLKKLASPTGQFRNTTPSSLYNGMIAPLVPYAIRGAIWYQGESNLADADYAAKTFALVQGWRDAWGVKKMPFHWVQLAPFTYRGKSKEALPLSWEQQTMALGIADTGMAIINDVGDATNIHPGDKTTVAARLARLAFSRVYGEKFVDDSGPLMSDVVFGDGAAVTVRFKHAASGLKTRDGAAPSHFEIAGEDGPFVPAVARIEDGTVVLSAENVPAPAFVRFAWDQNAAPNLTNGEGLPAGAFRAKKNAAAEFPKPEAPAPKPAAAL